MIVFHAQTLTIGALARVVANGGGGGGGAGNNDPGDDGIPGDPANPLLPSLGGQAATTGRCPGGNGAAGTMAPTNGTSFDNGGGGGGGGFGQIRILKGGTPASFPAGTVSPTPTT